MLTEGALLVLLCIKLRDIEIECGNTVHPAHGRLVRVLKVQVSDARSGTAKRSLVAGAHHFQRSCSRLASYQMTTTDNGNEVKIQPHHEASALQASYLACNHAR